ncbi:MAG: single-stranded DNA-binding protein [Succinivibrio sp.]|nr:single-stranded DNA-binding protein [Succinivibrio sp.]
MDLNNYVFLCGKVTAQDNIRYVSTERGEMICFELMTSELWHTAEGERNHDEYHHIVLRDNGAHQMATRGRDLVIPGNRLLISGRLRHRLIKSQTKPGVVRHITEVDADNVEQLYQEASPQLMSAVQSQQLKSGQFNQSQPQVAPPQQEEIPAAAVEF